jgi:ADP-heptose:LPS heptosyltransferase
MAILASQLAAWSQWTLNKLLPEHKAIAPPLDRRLRSIVVITPWFIGDTLLSTVFIQNLRQQFPQNTKIYLIAPANQINLLETLPGIAHIYAMPATLSQKQALLKILRCDALFLLRFSIPWALAGIKAGTPYRIGFNLERFGLVKLQTWHGLLSHATPSGCFNATSHQINCYKTMLMQVGFGWDTQIKPILPLAPEDFEDAKAMLSGLAGQKIVIHASAGSPGKKWAIEKWVELIEKLFVRYHAHIISVGRESDETFYQKIESLSGVPINNFCGKTSLRTSAVLCRQSDLVITLDTALAHIAAAAEAPRLVVLYGPTNLQQWRPLPYSPHKTHLEQVSLQVPCRPCIPRTCYHRSCMRHLSVEKVLQRIEKTGFGIRNV